MRRKKRSPNIVPFSSLAVQLVIHLLFAIDVANSFTFNGIPAAFGDLDLDKRTDIVAIGDDGTRIDIYYQHGRQNQPPFFLGYSCKSDLPIAQVYLADIDSDPDPNILPLVLKSKSSEGKVYSLRSLNVTRYVDQDAPPYTTKLSSSTTYSLATAAALNSDAANYSSTNNSSVAESQPLRAKPVDCEFTELITEMRAQPLLFDLDGDLRTDFMSLDEQGHVSVWKPPKFGSDARGFEKLPTKDWTFISKDYFSEPHSNSFIDINNDHAADIVFSSNGKIAYSYADPDPSKSFKTLDPKKFDKFENYIFGQSSLVDIDADGKIDHVIPRCAKSEGTCDIIAVYGNGHRDIIFKFDNRTGAGDSKHYYDFKVESHELGKDYQFPITLRASDLDGDGYTDFVAVARNNTDSKNKVVYLHNIPVHSKTDNFTSGQKAMTRTFEIIEINHPFKNPNQIIQLVTLFDINEDGKVDMLVGASDNGAKPEDMNISAIMNTQMVDACFMKVLVTNGFYAVGARSDGQSARGPMICFELSQNDGNKMQGCAGQLSSSSHFALQQPYVIFGLGQTPHFVETLDVSIPGFGQDKKVRSRLIEQIVPDAQVIIIPRLKDNPNSWDFKMFLSPMSDMVLSTLIALAALCILISLTIFVLHYQETLEDAAEHEEYKRHWPESR